MLRYCPALQSLLLTQVFDLTASGLESVAVRCPHLHTLSLIWCLSVEMDGFLHSLAGQCTQLRSFTVKGYESLTDPGMCALIATNPLLEALDVSDCSRLSDTTMYALAKHCPQLCRVCINGCWKITSSGLTALRQDCLHLICVE
jgi:hypothetical protein